MLSTRLRESLLFLVFSGAISLVLLTIGIYQLVQFMDSNGFCGRLCHTVMYPEYTTYQVSPHSRVACVACHVGPGADYLVKSKIAGIPQVFYTLTNTYPRPITTPVKNLRPARDTCEQCHRPELFSGDTIRHFITYGTDESNTMQDTLLALRIGGGEAIGQDIHWHIGAKVWYLALDGQRQDIGWVGVENSDGSLTEWINPNEASQVTPERIQQDKRLMDCIDCHNRATHIFSSPQQLIDTAMVEGRIDTTLPYVKLKSLQALDPPSTSLTKADARIKAIVDYYRNEYPLVYTAKRASIDNLVVQLKKIAELTTFPDMNVDWNTHPDNAGHQEAPGCLRCHGRLVEKGASSGEVTIDASCDLCHYPVNVTQTPFQVVNIPHQVQGFTDCLSCHGPTAGWLFPSDHTGRTNST